MSTEEVFMIKLENSKFLTMEVNDRRVIVGETDRLSEATFFLEEGEAQCYLEDFHKYLQDGFGNEDDQSIYDYQGEISKLKEVKKVQIIFKEVEDKSKQNIIHDCFVDHAREKPTEEQLDNLMKKVPGDIVQLADQWGWYDTEVREKVYSWVEKEVKGIE